MILYKVSTKYVQCTLYYVYIHICVACTCIVHAYIENHMFIYIYIYIYHIINHIVSHLYALYITLHMPIYITYYTMYMFIISYMLICTYTLNILDCTCVWCRLTSPICSTAGHVITSLTTQNIHFHASHHHLQIPSDMSLKRINIFSR